MNFFRAVVFFSFSLLLGASARALETTWIYSVMLNARVSADPARVELEWAADPYPVAQYTLHRRAFGTGAWSEGIPLGGDATGFVDENVELGTIYEYQVVKTGTGYTGYGYIAAGINAPLVDDRGRVILLVDQTFSEPLGGEIARLQSDLAGDGWTVIRHDVARDTSPHDVKAVIKREYDGDPERTRAVFLLGRLPIIHSGNLNVDGHAARPLPADVFYGDMDGAWTDANGDGILDQNQIPSAVELQVGRVDFADLPGRLGSAFPDELELMRRYLNKNHAFRQATTRPKHRALVGGLADANGQAYSASGFRNFSALVGATNIALANSELASPAHERWISYLSRDDYLWVYGGGGGGDNAISGLGTHGEYNDVWNTDLLEQKAKGTFYLFFGSWLLDWSKTDNIMRSALASPDYGLAASWSGRPHHFYHHVGVGETLGYSIRLTQNNDGTVYRNQVQRQLRGIHIALIGDPTLRMHQIAPALEAKAVAEGSAAIVTWKRSTDAVIGYHVYRATNANGPFTRLTEAPIDDTRFADLRPLGESAIYMVRAVALINGPSGSFYNASHGAFARLEGTVTSAVTAAEPNGTKPTDLVWVDDELPAGAGGHAERDRWNWVTENPAPFSGARAHQADIAAGRHHHFFAPADTPLDVAAGETLFAYVYLDPANPPRQIMLTWLADNHWEHRAYWGENLIDEGVDGTAGRRHIGPLPPTGRWIRLELPASAVGMENRRAYGMGFTLYDGRATWDRAGKSR